MRVVDFSTYQPPGVVIEEDLTPIFSVTSVAATVIAIVGPGVGYQNAQEQITLNGSTPVMLSQLGIMPNSVVVTDVAGDVVDPANYTLTVGAGADGSISSSPQDNTLEIARTGTGLPDASVVFVAYNYQNAAYFQPQKLADFDSVKAMYGEPIDLTTGNVLSHLTLAAWFAFQNGANQIVFVATPTPAAGEAVSQADLQAAYDKIADDFTINVLVPLPVGVDDAGSLAYINDLKLHCESQARGDVYRVGLYGPGTLTSAPPDSALAEPVASQRVAVVYPNRLNYYVGTINTTIVVGGYFLAAAIAGRLAGLRVQDPLTKKAITGFSVPALPTTLSMSLRNQYSANGVLVAEVNRANQLVIRHGRTTLGTNVMTRELSLVRARDALISLLQAGMDASGLVGTAIDINTPLTVKGAVQGLLETAVASGIITAYSGLQVRQQVAPSGDPTIIEVKFAYKPAYPLNYIVISFSVDVTTGETDLTAA